jgi:hypothetical protein
VCAISLFCRNTADDVGNKYFLLFVTVLLTPYKRRWMERKRDLKFTGSIRRLQFVVKETIKTAVLRLNQP